MNPTLTIAERLNRGDFIVSVQVDPPHYSALEDFRNAMRALKDAGAETVDVNSSRRVSHDSIHLSVALQREFGFEAIPHITTRDSSINGLVNELYAAYEWGGLRTALVITGDPYEAAQAIVPTRGVYHTNAIGAIQALNEHLRKNPRLALNLSFAAAINQNEPDQEYEKDRIRKKQDAGTDFFMSQPVFSETQTHELRALCATATNRPLIIGIWPLIQEKTIAAIQQGKIVGVNIPDDIYHEAQRHISQGTLGAWGIEKARSLVAYIRDEKLARGIYIVAPSRNPLLIIDLVKNTINAP